MKKALIFGMSGQDGSYLAEHLLSLGYEVHGTVRRNSTPEHQESRLDHLADQLHAYYGDLQDELRVAELLTKIGPDEVYNLAAQSHVRISFEIPLYTARTNAIGPLTILESIKQLGLETRYYQASSSEMFGDSVDPDGFQRETTPMTPVSPYGIAKLFGYHATRNYRKAHGIHASNGILFNHESPRRASNFVTSKVVKTAVQIKLGLADHLVLGNLDSKRDWGHSKDYVRAIHAIMTAPKPDDYVVATGSTRSIRDLVELVFDSLGLDVKSHVRQDPKFMRPEELSYLQGDASKIRESLGWVPEISFEDMISEMIDHWLHQLTKS